MMIARPRNAQLQHRILLALDKAPASSIAELAERVEALRPSASRSLHALKDAGMVSREGHNWVLTDVGRREALHVAETIVERSGEMNLALARNVWRYRLLFRLAGSEALSNATRAVTANMDIMKPMIDVTQQATQITKTPDKLYMQTVADIAKSLEGSAAMGNGRKSAILALGEILRQLSYSSNLKEIVNSASGLYAGNEATKSLLKSSALTEASVALAKSQLASLSLLQASTNWWHTPFASNWLIAESNEAIGSMLSDITALGTATLLNADYSLSLLSLRAASTVIAYDSFFRISVATLAEKFTGEPPEPAMVGLNISKPTMTTSAVIAAIRDVIETDILAGDSAYFACVRRKRSGEGIEQYLAETDAALCRLGPRFGQMWRGAWATWYSDSPDRLRQSLHSGRELLSQALEELAPDHVFTKEEIMKDGHNGRPTRSMRVKRILKHTSKERAPEWADQVAEAFVATYNHMSSRAHSHEDDIAYSRQQVGALLSVIGGLLSFMIESLNIKESEDKT